ncbi:PsiF family protein [Rhodoplanes azumiensis]|uniref:PsiF family protein n=1 Tax=Rhodoplanes azumiensis TaxID=1897628 RepID=A0ABW5AFN0_9BRAD
MSRFVTTKDCCWTRRGWAAVLAAGWLALAALPVAAQDAKPTTEKPTTDKPADTPAAAKTTADKPTAAKKTSAQQQRMKDCAGKWKEEKAAKNVKGREAYRTFMSGCLKG